MMKAVVRRNAALWAYEWPVLEQERGWTLRRGARATDVLFLPPGVDPASPTMRVRRDYFDSVRTVRALHRLSTRLEMNTHQVLGCSYT